MRSAADSTPVRAKCSAISSARFYYDDNIIQFMKILVSFKSVPDPNEATLAGAAASAAKSVINPFDEIAIEEALRIRERGDAVEIVAVTIGAPAVEEQVRAALAMGVDRAIRIDDSRALDPYAVARILRALVEKEMPQVVIMGKQAVDDDSNQVGQMLAALLGSPQATFVSKVEFLDNKTRARCTRETDAGLEVVAIDLPAVITTDLRLNQPRYVSLPGLIKARRRPIETLTCNELRVEVRPLTTVLSIANPPKRAAGTRVDSVEELIAKLKQEAKVL
jgi:electron transfer flavoprotein beta subunit